jgi:CRISPR-associated protein Cmr5
MTLHTRSQRLAQAAFARVKKYGKPGKDYVSFAKKFPALVHACGLAQAVTFALAKKESDYIDDLAAVVSASGHPAIVNASSLDQYARSQEFNGYLRLSRDAINAASWLKRYAEALGEDG